MRHLDSKAFTAGIALLFIAAMAACGDRAVEQNLLPALGVSSEVTVSGLSSGGYMAGQYQVAFSEHVAGAGIIAAGPWACAKGDISHALQVCVSGEGIDDSELLALAEEKANNGSIDALSHLGDARLFLFRGSKDEVVGSAAVDSAVRWFAEYADPANIKVSRDVPAAHGWPTLGDGGACDTFAAPYVYDCDYDLAGELLSHLYADLNPPAKTVRNVRRFDQRPFGNAELADFGYVYVPAICEGDGDCRVHVFFHGCEQSANVIGTELVEHSGLNRWAETNGIVVLYPQVEKSLAAPMNPLGCWDWWGYTGANYLERSGAQLSAVKRMVEKLASQPEK